VNPLLDALAEGCARWNLTLTGEQMDALDRYYRLLVEANARMNLTTVTDPAAAARRHFLDALCPPALAVLPPGAAAIDVGSGAGIPGLPLAIARPDIRVTLTDARRKKTDFMSAVISELRLPNAAALWGRAEDMGREAAHRERYDCAMARGVAQLPTLCEYLLPFARTGGRMLAWKGPDAWEELKASRPAIAALGGGNPELRPYAISREFCSFSLIVCEKIRPTPPAYPRPSGKPVKNPLGLR
jgi:16S rRNA (guanine527-N7)-methyltransferase